MALDTEKLNSIFLEAKARYNKLKSVPIHLKVNNGYFFTMCAKVELLTLLKRKRHYVICINVKREKLISQLSHSDLIGWFGHELTHVMEYEKMTAIKFVCFIIKYTLNKQFRSRVEKQTNTFAFNNGFARELFDVWKKLMLFDNISIKYKNYIRENYKPDWSEISHEAESIGLNRNIYELN